MLWFERKFTFGHLPAMLPYMLERLDGTIVRIQEKVSGISDAHLALLLDGKWSVKQNVGHLLEVDQISGKRIGEITNGSAVLTRADVQPEGDYNEMGMAWILDRFAAGRRANIARFRALSEPALRMTSLHPRLKVPMNPVDLAWFDAEHDDHHLFRISTILTSVNKLS